MTHKTNLLSVIEKNRLSFRKYVIRLNQKTLENVLLMILLIFGFVIRFRRIGWPNTGSFIFRRTQTAWGIRSFADGNYSPFSIETPVLGPPWRIPFEFPLYQMIAGLLVRLSGLTVETGGRLTAIIFFIGSAFVFYKICRIFLNANSSLCVLAIFLFNGHNLNYGSAILIEYCAVFFALLSFLVAIKFLKNNSYSTLIIFF